MLLKIGKVILAAMEQKDSLQAELERLEEEAHHHEHHHEDECDNPNCCCHHHHDEEHEHEHGTHEHHHEHRHDDECDDPNCCKFNKDGIVRPGFLTAEIDDGNIIVNNYLFYYFNNFFM